MRMHSYSKCSPNLVVGALSVFTLIVLYNYWNISTYNRDLVLKLHSVEQQVISFSRANEGLSTNIEKLQDEKSKLQGSLQREEMQGKDSRDVVQQKEKIIKDLQNDLELSKQELQNCRDETATLETKGQSRDKEISDLKEKVVSLEAQVVEKTSYNEKLETELSDAKDKVEQLQKTLASKPTAAASKSTAASVGAKPVPQPEEVLPAQQQPQLLNDPAVPYPDGWMKAGYAQRHVPKVKVQDVNVGLRGMKYHGSPIIIFDDPKTPKKTARYSVLDPPAPRSPISNRYGLDLISQSQGQPRGIPINIEREEPKLPLPLAQPKKIPDADPEAVKDAAIENEADGVLPIPGQNQDALQPIKGDNPNPQQVPQPPQGGNLDAAEDDGDRQVKEDQALQDDQSPDGALPPNKDKESVAVVPAPLIKQQDIAAPLPPHSGQDVREAAHLNNNL